MSSIFNKILIVSLFVGFCYFISNNTFPISIPHFEKTCHLKSKVESIIRVHHRTAYVMLDNGFEMSLDQPDNLKSGDIHCLITKATNEDTKEVKYHRNINKYHVTGDGFLKFLDDKVKVLNNTSS